MIGSIYGLKPPAIDYRAMDPSRLFHLIKSRRTVRKLREMPMNRRTIGRILSAGIWAPSAHNAQPWRFVVVQDESIKHEMLVAMGSKWREDLRRDGLESSSVERVIASSTNRFLHTTVIIVVAVTMEDMDIYSDEKRNSAEKIMAIQSASAAIQNVLLMAHSFGIGAVWSCAPLFAKKEVRSILGMEKEWEPIAMIALGKARERPGPPHRRSLKEVSVWI